MALFDVYVEGATDASPQALARLAEVMSQRYGLPAAELVVRLSKGRFRVKANVDEATAQTYVRDLEAVGARVTIADARGASTLPPPARTKPASQPPPHPITVPPRMRNESKGSYSISSRAGIPLPDDDERPASPSSPPPLSPRTLSKSAVPTSTLPPRTGSPSVPPSVLPPRANAASLPPQTVLPPRTGNSTPPANQPFSSGLSAAFGETAQAPEAFSFDNLSVGSLDDGAAQVETSPTLPASIGPAARPVVAKVDKPKDVPVDLFAPPEAQSEEFKVELAPEEVAHRERKRTPPAAVPIAVPPSPTSPVLRPKLPTERSAGVRLPSISSDEAPRGRYAAGVLTAIVLGFIPATMVQSCREDAAFEKIDAHVATVQQQAATSNTSPVPFAKLDEFREEQIARKKSERRNIAIVSMLIWALGSAGVGYVWFRKLPWDKIKFS